MAERGPRRRARPSAVPGAPYTDTVLGVSGGEFFVILLVIVLVVGPQRLPEYTRVLAQGVRQLRVFLDDAKKQIAEEVGPELGDLNLSDLDPRNYDPRKIVRDALGEDLDAIRKDLTNPFSAVAEAAKSSSDDAAGAMGEGHSSKSLKEMIDEKADERRAQNAAAKAASAESAAAEPVEVKDPAEAAAEAAAVTAELPQVDPAEVSETDQPAGPAPTAGTDETAAAEGTTETAETAEAAEPSGETAEPTENAEGTEDEVEDPERRALLAGVVDGATELAEDVAAIVDPEPETELELATGPESTPAGAVSTVEALAAAEPAPAVVPSSLEDPVTAGAVATARPRLLSPREIVRAANAAARTRAEAAAARVDA